MKVQVEHIRDQRLNKSILMTYPVFVIGYITHHVIQVQNASVSMF